MPGSVRTGRRISEPPESVASPATCESRPEAAIAQSGRRTKFRTIARSATSPIAR